MNSMFDPWTATWEQAADAHEAHRAAGDDGPDAPLYQWEAAQHVTELRSRVEAGLAGDLMAAVAECARTGIAMPDWLAEHFLRGYYRILDGSVGSWDEAFGNPFGRRTVLELYRLRRRKTFELFNFFTAPGAPPRTPAGFKQAAAALGITPSQARQWTPKTRINTRGHKPYRQASHHGAAHDPFQLATTRAKSS